MKNEPDCIIPNIYCFKNKFYYNVNNFHLADEEKIVCNKFFVG